MIAIDTAGIFVSGSHCGIPASQAATSDSRNASFGVFGGREEHAERKSAPTPSAARPPSKRNSRRCTRRYYTGDALTYGAAGLPPGLTLNPATGLISGTMSVASVTHAVTVMASDASATSTQAFTWTVTHFNSPN